MTSRRILKEARWMRVPIRSAAGTFQNSAKLPNTAWTLTSLIIAITTWSADAFAVNRYMSLAGSDVGNCANESSPCNSLGYAMSQMQAGDVLVIDDGVYTGAENSIWQFQVPKSGTAGAFTTIRAKNIPGQNGVPANQPLRVHFDGASGAIFNVQGAGNGAPKYVKFQGIRWDGIVTYGGWDHIYFKQCASQGIDDGNGAAITIGGGYNLLEDVVAFGKGRYKILFYDYIGTASDNLCRRCIVRQDWANRDIADIDMPVAGITSYYTRRNAFLNTIVIDSDLPNYWDNTTIELAGAFYQPNDGGPNAMTIQGSLVINSALPAVYVSNGSSGHTITDFAAAKVAGGLGLPGSVNVNRLTLVDVGTNNFTYRSTGQRSKVLTADLGISGLSVTLANAILRDIAGTGVSGTSASYTNIFASAGGAGITPTYTFDPFVNGLKHPTRIEVGSPLATAGSGGGQIGARILNRLGVDGTFKGDPNWNTEQGPLWPWPLEDWIQAEMRSMDSTIEGDTMPPANRGFCASGQTLSKYIWEHFGTPIPSDIYGTPSDSEAPNITSFSLPSSSATFSVPVTAFTATDNTGVTGYIITQSATAPSAGATGWTPTTPTSFTFSGTGMQNAYAWAKDATGNVSASLSRSVNITYADTNAPSVPAAVSGMTVSHNRIDLTWRPSTDNLAVTGYKVYRNGTLIGTAVSTTYSDNNLAAATTYDYTVSAYDAAGNNSSQTSVMSISTFASSTGSLVLGYDSIGANIDSSNSNFVNATQFLMGSQAGQAISMSVYIAGPISAAPNNQFRLAIYSDSAGAPGSLLGMSAPQTITPNSWNTVPLSTPLSANTAYWLAYNTNGATAANNNLAYSGGSAGQTYWMSAPFGDFPDTFLPNPSDSSSAKNSLYVTYSLATPDTSIPFSPISSANWRLHFVDSQETNSENTPAVNAFDGNSSTFWHTKWAGTNSPPPHEIQIDLQTTQLIDGFSYLPRQDGSSNGGIGDFEFFISSDGITWNVPVATGTFNNHSLEKRVHFIPTMGRYVRLKALSEINGNPWTAVAEIGVSRQSLVLDTIAPVVSAFAIPSTATSLNIPVSTFTATDAVGVTGYMITESSSAPAAGAAGWSATAPTSFTFSGAGTRTAYAWAKDAAGNVSASLSRNVTITLSDTTAPSVSISSPASQATLKGTVTLSATATDNVGVTKVDFFVDGSLIGSDSSSPYNISWNTASLSSGAHSLTARAYDAAGNVTTSAAALITLRRLPRAPLLTRVR